MQTGIVADSLSVEPLVNPQMDDAERAAEIQGSDEDRALRPQRLADYIGQAAVKQQLFIALEAARRRNEALEHVIISGPPGLGKTTLARIIARELNVELTQSSGPALEKKGDAAALLTNLKRRDVLFIDEIHRLTPVIEEFLYPAMEDYLVDVIIGEGPAARSLKIDLQPFTLIGATTRDGALTAPLRARFGIILKLDFYRPEELKLIIEASARKLGISMDEEGALEIARRSRGTPRIANRLLKRVRDWAEVEGNGRIDRQSASQALKMLGIDEDGLDEFDRAYLNCIMEMGRAAGVDSLAATMGQSSDTLEQVVEPYLLQQGFIRRTRSGRLATERCWHKFGREAPAEV